MFERYTEKARRVIFFARYEASQFGSSYIETEHLLMGILREDKWLTNRFLRSRASVESILKQIEAHTTIREPVSTSVDLPLSNECKRVLAYAGEEAERLGHEHIGTEHLLLGLLREEKCFGAQILKDRGVQLGAVREDLARISQESAARSPLESTPLTGLFRDLTQAAIDGRLEPIVGRDLELDSILEIFSNCRNKNPVLIGEHGAGKTAIVEGVAQRIADGGVPSFLADKRILVFEPELIAGWAKERHGFQELTKIVRAQQHPSEVILFLDELDGMLVSTSKSGWPEAAGIFKHALLHQEIQCIAAATPNGYREATQAIPWLEQCFRTIHVRPLDEESTFSVLLARKHRLEKFHRVTYTDEALECAAHCFGRHFPGSPLPGKALELLDAAGSRVKLRHPWPLEVADSLKRVKDIGQRLENAIGNHEFEKAKFYSDEERKEKENLRVLREKHHLDDSSSAVVGREDIEEILSRWAKYPFCP